MGDGTPREENRTKKVQWYERFPGVDVHQTSLKLVLQEVRSLTTLPFFTVLHVLVESRK